MTCDSVVDQVNHVNNGVLANLTDQDFSAAYDCEGKSNDVIMLINYVAGAGCCEGKIDIQCTGRCVLGWTVPSNVVGCERIFTWSVVVVHVVVHFVVHVVVHVVVGKICVLERSLKNL